MNAPRKVVFTLVAICLAVIAIGGFSVAKADQGKVTKQTQLTFVNHLAAGMAEQDVYVAAEPGSNLVKRIAGDELAAYGDQPVFTSDRTVDHDPFQVKSEPIGPYPKGFDLGFTMDEWLAASGTGTYAVAGNLARIDVTFTNLVPNGVYTLWCAHIHVPPAYKIIDEPCGAPTGTRNVFTADENGNAQIRVITPAVPETNEEVVQVVAAAYHSDNKTYGPHPGNFGLNSHVQIVAFLPAVDDPAWETVSGQ
jgi:hypothetical protein